MSSTREANWAWDDALATLRAIRSTNPGSVSDLSHSPKRSLPIYASRAAPSAQERTSALLDLLRARQSGGSLLDEQLRAATLRGCEKVMDRWEQMIYYRRQVRTLRVSYWRWQRAVRRTRRLKVFSLTRQRSRLGRAFLIYRSVYLIISSKRRQLSRTQHLLETDYQFRVLSAWSTCKDAKRSSALRCQRLLDRGRRFVLSNKCGTVFAGWTWVVERACSLRAKEFKLQLAVLPSKVRQAMGAWKSVLKANMQRLNMELEENTMFRKLFRWTMSPAIDAWRHYIKQMNIAEHVDEWQAVCARKAMGRRTQKLKLLLCKWQRYANVCELRRRAERVIRRVSWRACVAALTLFRSWRQRVSDGLRLRRLTGKVVVKVLRAPLKCWFECTAEKTEQKRKTRLLLASFMNSTILSSLRRWQITSREAMRNKSKIKQVLRRLLLRAVAMAFGRWLRFCQETKDIQLKLVKVLQFMTKVQMSKSINKWKSDCHEAKRFQRICKRIIHRMMCKTMAVAIQIWACTASEQVMTKKRVGALIFRRGLSFALNLWRKKSRGHQMVRKSAQKIIFRLIRNSVVNCYEFWRETVTALKWGTTIVRRVVLRMQRRSLKLAFIRWTQKLCDQGKQRLVVRRVALKLLRRLLTMTFASWVALKNTTVSNKSRLFQVIQRINNIAVACCWGVWIKTVLENKRILAHASSLMSILRAVHGRTLVTVDVYFYAWADGLQKEMKKEHCVVLSPEVEKALRPVTTQPFNIIRIAKGFFQWGNNLWWARELTIQHERFVLLLQQRESSNLLRKWEPFMVNPHGVRTTSSPCRRRSSSALEYGITPSATGHLNSSPNTSNQLLDSSVHSDRGKGAEKGGDEVRIWGHVYQNRENHRIPTTPSRVSHSLHSSPSKYSHLGASPNIKIRPSPQRVHEALKATPTRIFQHSHQGTF